MHQHWDQSPSISYYAELRNMSQLHFLRLFKEHTVLSPVDYRNALRLEEARSKLQSGEYNVSEVAELCGFASISFFTRSYKKAYGYSPKNE
jgi:transcriptional regulator GlxA family with amidase domain